jgi:putative PIN family toxin of toxin-antitoxin system
MSPRVVLDTNLYISGLFYGGLPGKLLALASERTINTLISDATLDELRRKLGTRFPSSSPDAGRILSEVVDLSSFVIVSEAIHVCRDPDDDRMLECAVAGHADYVITGDKDLLVLHPFRGIPIVSARYFLENHIF